MKFYKGDIVSTQACNTKQVESYDPKSGFYFTTDRYNYTGDSLVLIRRADEPAWPDDVPRCELPLHTDERYAFTGYQHWSSPSQLFCWNGKWDTSYGPVSGDPKLPTCKVVDDADYTPPASEPASPPQGEGKITKESRVVRLRHKDMLRYCVEIDITGMISVDLDGQKSMTPNQARWMAELLTAAAGEVQSEH